MSNKIIERHAHRHDEYLKQLLADYDIAAPRLKEAITYALFPGGKRLRPVLVYLIGQLLKIDLACLDILAAAIELTHAYSLIHDDLPAMDDDDMRRGKPSCHKAFDEATAILAGDGLQGMAVEILLNKLPAYLPATQVVAVANALTKATGVSGMVSGQCLDLSELSQPGIDEQRLRFIHSLKTGQLILACATMPLAAATDVKPDAAQAIREFAAHLGLVFQMQDDYLDQYAEKTHGKGRASDLENEKMTFAALHSKTELQSLIKHHYSLAFASLEPFGDKADELRQLTESLEQRR
ncbi:polyprenyl synthetase family protein [Legionella taurinensis]|uniref:Geranyl transferase n=1 Tax=Legionella taurinensis TaxID=70611 RepID=A0A3A5LAZ5_9GAMM|nr:polyprenyl synthetase family protein [Legionella taurinensis]MDX1837745.1 polyprenyl synthetase family protein [Legionella taurinensis]PUT40025.1 geranyl transferase [Legionella taurinensis]PUT43791.1 geranyl transferase [Legionella taurinensis]PUT46076.1 geranyl transferase [Legionella taurinensis]PUT47946.1 geranyl transferase [Legionella taurinensis]